MVMVQRRDLSVFVNDFRIKVRDKASVRDAIRAYDRAFLKAIEFNKAEVMDADGCPVPLDAPVVEWDHIFVCLLPWVNVPHRRKAAV
jgi:hypothetical protein